MKGKIEIIRNNDIEKMQAAADKVIKAYEATVEIADDALEAIDSILGDDDWQLHGRVIVMAARSPCWPVCPLQSADG